MSDLQRPYPAVTDSTNPVKPSTIRLRGKSAALSTERHHHHDCRGHGQRTQSYVGQDPKRPLAGRPPRFPGDLTARIVPHGGDGTCTPLGSDPVKPIVTPQPSARHVIACGRTVCLVRGRTVTSPHAVVGSAVAAVPEPLRQRRQRLHGKASHRNSRRQLLPRHVLPIEPRPLGVGIVGDDVLLDKASDGCADSRLHDPKLEWAARHPKSSHYLFFRAANADYLDLDHMKCDRSCASGSAIIAGAVLQRQLDVVHLRRAGVWRCRAFTRRDVLYPGRAGSDRSGPGPSVSQCPWVAIGGSRGLHGPSAVQW